MQSITPSLKSWRQWRAAGGGRALILFSDGLNSIRGHQIQETIEAAQIADTRIFTMLYYGRRRRPNTSRPPPRALVLHEQLAEQYGIGVMERLARETGGGGF
jgi:hypothetical protein